MYQPPDRAAHRLVFWRSRKIVRWMIENRQTDIPAQIFA
jgi:hypothetical protein